MQEVIDLLEKAMKKMPYVKHNPKGDVYCLVSEALAKLREVEPTELTKWLRKVIASERYEKGDKKLQTKVRKACDIIGQLQAQVKSQAKHIELLKQCDDSSTETIAKMDSEIIELQAQIDKQAKTIKLLTS